MRVILTGANGFIGTHLRHRLSEQGDTVFIIPRETLYSKHDLTSFFLKVGKVDFIIHMAAYGNHYFQTEPNIVFDANLLTLENLLEASIPQFKAFINFSTTHHNLEAGSFYGATKAGGEYLTRAYVRNCKMPIVNIRPYSVFGEYEWSFRFIPTISAKIQRGEPITVTDVSHDWIYVEDFLDGVFAAMKNYKKLIGQSVGIGTGTRVSNIHIAKTLMDSVGKLVPMGEGEKRQYEIAAYGKELQNQNRDQRAEVEYFQFAKTPLDEALRRVYNSPDKWLLKNDVSVVVK